MRYVLGMQQPLDARIPRRWRSRDREHDRHAGLILDTAMAKVKRALGVLRANQNATASGIAVAASAKL
jgi:hypothetical protein